MPVLIRIKILPSRAGKLLSPCNATGMSARNKETDDRQRLEQVVLITTFKYTSWMKWLFLETCGQTLTMESYDIGRQRPDILRIQAKRGL